MGNPALKLDEPKKRGRPKGTKTKKTLDRAIQLFEAHQQDAAQLIVDVMRGALEGVTMKEQVAAAKYVITAPSQMRKGLQETKETIESGIDPDDMDEEDVDEGEKVIPLVSLTIVDPTFIEAFKDE
jgi:hypothetical protein